MKSFDFKTLITLPQPEIIMDIGKPLKEIDVIPQEVPMTPVAPPEPVPQEVPVLVPTHER